MPSPAPAGVVDYGRLQRTCDPELQESWTTNPQPGIEFDTDPSYCRKQEQINFESLKLFPHVVTSRAPQAASFIPLSHKSALHCPFSHRFPIHRVGCSFASSQLGDPAVLAPICLPHPLEISLAHLGIQSEMCAQLATRSRQHLSPRPAIALAHAVSDLVAL